MVASVSLRTSILQFNHYFLPTSTQRNRRKLWKKRNSNFIKAQTFRCSYCSRSHHLETHFRKITDSNGFLGNADVELVEPSSSSRQVQEDQIDELVSAVQSCSSLREAKRVHAALLKLVGSSVTFVNNNLMSTYVRFGRLSDARMLFDEMLEKNIVSWTALLNGYLKMGLEDEFLMLFNEMFENHVQFNSSTFVCILKFCSKVMDFELGRQIHALIVKGNWGNLIVESSLVYFYAQCSDISDAFAIFDGMKRLDVVSWTAMITACAQNGLGNESFTMFLQMQSYGFSPNEFTVCSVVKACGEEKALRFGRQLHGAIVKRMYPDDVFIGNSLVGMYVKCDEIIDARTVFDFMPNRNTVTWTSMIAGYAQKGFGEEAIELFERMKRKRVLANSSTLVSILSACGSFSTLYMGKEVHAHIMKNCIQDNMHIGSTLIWFYCKCGEYTYAARVLEGMPMRDVVSWTAMVSGHTGFGHDLEALGFLNGMLQEGVEANPFTYSSALKACTKMEATRQGQLIHAFVSKTCALANVYVGSALISLYMKSGCTDDAFRIFNTLPERNVVTWKTMVVGYAKNGLCQEALKLMYQMRAEGLKVDDFVLSIVLNSCGGIHWKSDCNSTCFLSD